jgi:predicted methyltransferase
MTIVEKYVKNGDIVIDATAGNGNDTLALLNLVGDNGKVYAFDIQEEAIEKTKHLLEESSFFKMPSCNILKSDTNCTASKTSDGLSFEKNALQVINNVILICDSHEKIAEYIEEKGQISAVVFNLGYLPSGDKSKSTKEASSIKAISESLKILKPGGIVSVVMYPGTELGKAERDAVLSYSKELLKDKYHVCYCNFPNQLNMPPEILWIEVKTI